jgi:hypothetical protein
MKNKITILGTYGDFVNLHLDGYVGTKYGDFFKIKSVDIENITINFHDDTSLDFSRISYSCPKNKQSDKEYLDSLNHKISNLGIKLNSVIKYKNHSTAPILDFKIVDIIYPKLKDEDYLPKLKLKSNSEEITEVVIKDFDGFSRENLVEVAYTPYTLDEKLINLLSKHTDYSGERLMDKTKYLTELKELFNGN